mmetsp:Transcript_1460/g.1281  ORF Transcript_1460/g.1281 Transcript_1460/m.1281 type:complete len:103 (+) Transcript_1460:247-555(+)
MMDMKEKVAFIDKARDSIIEYHKLLGDLKELRTSLDFKPVFNVDQKLKELNKITEVHFTQSTEASATQREVSNLIENYNNVIDSISQKFALIDMKLTEVENK